MKYGWSTNPEDGYHGKYDSREEAMKAATVDFYGDADETMTVWTCEIENMDMGDFVPDIDFMLEEMAEALGEEVGEVAENFQPSDKQKAAFENAVKRAATKHLPADCWRADNTQRHEVDKDGKEVAA